MEVEQGEAQALYRKPMKPLFVSIRRVISYMLREQRLLFVLVGIAIATLAFTFPGSETQRAKGGGDRWGRFRGVTPGRQIDGNVIVVDNFFTGSKENVMHHFGNPNFELIRHDVVEPILLEVDQIYHLACPASPFNPVKTIKTNVVGTLNMLGLAKRVGARFLCSTLRLRLTGATLIPSVFGVATTKGSVRRRRWPWTTTEAPMLRIARIFNTYGPRMCIDDGRVVSNFVAQALRKEPLTVYGDGKQTRSFQFVSDL
ncbi:hypothetical protein DY000_02002607, partial [Brassica cretica]